MERLTRRNILGAASAFAGGALVAAPAAVAAASPTHDPLVALVAEHKRLFEISVPPGLTDDEVDAFVVRAADEGDDLCEQIIETPAISLAGLMAQAEMLKGFILDQGSIWEDERDVRLLDAIIAGAGNLAAGGAA